MVRDSLQASSPLRDSSKEDMKQQRRKCSSAFKVLARGRSVWIEHYTRLFESLNLACIVVTKRGDVLDIINVHIFDDTYDATLSLCGRVAKSAAYWKASCTILLLSNPGFRAGKKPTLCVNSRTYVDVDPCMADAAWLRGFAQRSTAREAINIPFPEGGKTGLSWSHTYKG